MKSQKNVPYLELIPILFISFVLYKVVNSTEIIYDAIKYVFSLLSYIIWGFIIAYLLNPIIIYIEKKFKIDRVWSITITGVFVLWCTVFIITILAPMLVDNVFQLLTAFSEYMGSPQKWVKNNIGNMQFINKYKIFEFVGQDLDVIIKKIGDMLNSSLSYVFKTTLNITSVIIKLVFGAIISIYLLLEKNELLVVCRGILYAFSKESVADNFLNTLKKVHKTFSNYISGVIIDSTLQGVICFLGLSIMGSPYAVLIASVITVSCFVPYLGALVGIAFSVIIVFLVSPVKALWVLIFLVLVKQFDDWYLNPRIIGGKVGVSPLFVLIAVIIGGGIAGVVGMLFAIPVFVILKDFLMEAVKRRLRNKKIDININ